MDEDLISRITVIQRKGEHSDAVTVYRQPRKRRKISVLGRPFEKAARSLIRSQVVFGQEVLACGTTRPTAGVAMDGCWKRRPSSLSRDARHTMKPARAFRSEFCRKPSFTLDLPEDMNMATQPATKEEHERAPTEKHGKSSLVVVELAKRRSPEQVRRLRKGHGKLLTDIEEAVEELRQVWHRQSRHTAGRDRCAGSYAAVAVGDRLYRRRGRRGR